MSFKSSILLFVALTAVIAIPHRNIQAIEETTPVVTSDLIIEINHKQNTWISGYNAKFEGMTIAQAKKLMGTYLDGPKPAVVNPIYDPLSIPDAFDARTAWTNCPSIPLVRDQSACGSCWAFGSTEAFNDRHCIATQDTTIIAAEDVLSCCGFSCGDGCDGGYPEMAWSYFKRTGSVTDSCLPYPFPACAHHVTSPKYPACPANEYPSPSCVKQCSDGSNFESSKIKATSTYSVSGEQNIMAELTKGPVTAAYTVYADFLTYKSGVYQHTSGQELGGHAVEIIGYGTDNGTKYWTVKNSWNDSWGNAGFFNILRGVDECGIESSIVTGTA